MPKKLNLKLNLLQEKEMSPYLLNLKKEKKSLPVEIKKIFSFILILVFVLTLFLSLKSIYFRAVDLKNNLLQEQTANLEIFFLASEALKNFHFEEAKNLFHLSQEKFSASRQKIEETGFLTGKMIKLLPQSSTGFYLLQSLEEVSKIGFHLAVAAPELSSLLNSFSKEENNEKEENSESPDEVLSAALKKVDLFKLSQFLKEQSRDLQISFNRLYFYFKKVNPNFVPENFQTVLKIIQDDLPKLKKKLEETSAFLTIFDELIGQNQMKRYLIFFQNNTEIRPTGGFLGTFALIDLDRGKIKNIEMPAGGTYSLRPGLSVNVLPPKQLFIAQLPWQFHDANWFADFPTSAKKLSWFYENSGGSSVDGVIAINLELIISLLAKIGPIEFTDYQKILTAENFNFETRKAIEEREERTKPRQFLVDLTPILIKTVLQQKPQKLFEITGLFHQGIEKKQIQFYFFDSSIQNFFTQRNWSGQVRETPKDYLLVTATNVNGAKTEGVIEQNIFYQAEIQADGSIISMLKVERKHNGKEGELFTGKTDLNYLRVYLPQGSIFLGAQGFVKKEMVRSLEEKLTQDKDLLKVEKEISVDPLSGTRVTEEFGKTCFGNFMELKPGETKEVFFKYLLPFRLNLMDEKPATYSLLMQKQSGRISNLTLELIFPEEPKILWQHPLEMKKEKEQLKFSTLLDRDKFIGLMFK